MIFQKYLTKTMIFKINKYLITINYVEFDN